MTSGITNSEGAEREAFPVSSIFISAVSTNPNNLLGYGTWESFGAGKVLVGVDVTDSDFNTPLKTGGAKTHTLTEAQMPSHTHIGNTTQIRGVAPSARANNSIAGIGALGIQTTTTQQWGLTTTANQSVHTTEMTLNADHTHTINNAGGGNAHNNLQPYMTVYMWKRTA